jgi:hypothetical protein
MGCAEKLMGCEGSLIGHARKLKAVPPKTSHPPVASLPFRNAGLPREPRGVSPALLTFSSGGSPLLQQGELDFSPAKKAVELAMGFSPGILRGVREGQSESPALKRNHRSGSFFSER